jgi:glycosyltransferase involved in cell wall biosynthesis
VRVLIVSQHYAPEITAGRIRLEAFARGLVKRGWDVEVLCAVPNHPEGVVHEGYRHRPLVRRELDGVRVRYVWVLASPRKTAARRLLLYGTYAASATLFGAVCRRPDVVLGSSPPLPAAAAAAAVAATHRVPWVMDVRDLWPEVAVVLGQLRGRRAISMAERLEGRLYRSAAAVVTATQPFADHVAATIGSGEKVTVIPNGTTQPWLDAAQREGDRKRWGLPQDRFIWAYAGNVGLSQRLESLVDAAALLDERFQLLVVGEGPMLPALRERAAPLPAGRVVFKGPVEPTEAPDLLRACDALCVPLDDDPALGRTIPIKLYDYCATGRPVIVAASGEPARVATEAGAALVIPPPEPDQLAGALRRVADDAELRERLVDGGRRFAQSNLREAHLGTLDEALRSAAANR